ncbi:MAG: hypothetical protein IT209_01875 [Armatimonadetes bacterium]|nr:hypothetical protein [Armatimonadota bacterium]
MWRRVIIAVLYLSAAVMVCSSQTSYARVFYVASDGSDARDGLSWASAKASIQAAVDAASAEGGGDIWVKAGTYSGLTSSFVTDSNEAVFPNAVDMLGEEKDLQYVDSNGVPQYAHLGVLYTTGSIYTGPPTVSTGGTNISQSFAVRMSAIAAANPDALLIVHHPNMETKIVTAQDLSAAANANGMHALEIRAPEYPADIDKWDYVLANLDDQAGACSKIVWGITSDDRHKAEPYWPFSGVNIGVIPTISESPVYANRRLAFRDMLRRGSIVVLPWKYRCGAPSYSLETAEGSASSFRVSVVVENVENSQSAAIEFYGCDPQTGSHPGTLLFTGPNVAFNQLSSCEYYLTSDGTINGAPLTVAQKANIKYIRPTVKFKTWDGKVRRAYFQPVRIRANGDWWSGPNYSLAGGQATSLASPYPAGGADSGEPVWFIVHEHTVVSDGDSAPSTVRHFYRGIYENAPPGKTAFGIVADHNIRTPFSSAIGAVVTLKENVRIYGGFAGTETLISQRNIETNVTSIDASSSGRCVYVDGSQWQDKHSASLDGLRFVNGAAPNAAGGGIYVWGCSPSVANCTFSNNAAAVGGGAFLSDSQSLISGCSFVSNTASSSGGGLFLERDSSGVVSGCIFSGNVTGDKGAGLSASSSSPTISRCTFTDNSAYLSSNWYWYAGGAGLHLNMSAAVVTGCTFLRNRARGQFSAGGAIRMQSPWDSSIIPEVASSVFAYNSADYYPGGAIYVNNSKGSVVNNTIVGNTSSQGGGGYFLTAPSLVFANNIVAYNSGGGGLQVPSGLPPVLRNNCYYENQPRDLVGLSPGSADFAANPQLADAMHSDFRLLSNSPCIDAGWMGASGLPLIDVNGVARIVGPSVDIGAAEYLTAPPAPVVTDDGDSTSSTTTLHASWALAPGFLSSGVAAQTAGSEGGVLRSGTLPAWSSIAAESTDSNDEGDGICGCGHTPVLSLSDVSAYDSSAALALTHSVCSNAEGLSATNPHGPTASRVRLAEKSVQSIAEFFYAIGTSPTDPHNGYTVDWKSAGLNTEATETDLDLQPGAVYYWYVKARMSDNAWTDVGVSNGIVVAPPTQIRLAELQLDGASASLYNLCTTAQFDGAFYAQRQDRAAGICVVWPNPVPQGVLVDVKGTLSTTQDGERVLLGTYLSIKGPCGARPLRMNNRAIAGSGFYYNPETGSGVQGVVTADRDLNNIGLLICAWGRVTYVDPSGNYFNINQGVTVHSAPIKDADGRPGVRVWAPGIAAPAVGSYVQVTGISACYKSEPNLYPRILVRDAADIIVHTPAP